MRFLRNFRVAVGVALLAMLLAIAGPRRAPRSRAH